MLQGPFGPILSRLPGRPPTSAVALPGIGCDRYAELDEQHERSTS